MDRSLLRGPPNKKNAKKKKKNNESGARYWGELPITGKDGRRGGRRKEKRRSNHASTRGWLNCLKLGNQEKMVGRKRGDGGHHGRRNIALQKKEGENKNLVLALERGNMMQKYDSGFTASEGSWRTKHGNNPRRRQKK